MPNTPHEPLAPCAKRAARLAAVAVALLLPGIPATAQDVVDAPSAPRIVVVGEGRVDQAPDMATITLGAVNEAATAAEALAATSEATARILDGLAAAGVAARDIRTDALSLSPRLDYSRGAQPDVTGYIASNSVQVRVRDLALLGARLDAAVAAGGNRFDGLAFGLQDPVPAEDAARTLAVRDALRKAALYAAAAGLRLGPVISIVEQGSFAGPAPMFRSEASVAAPAVPVAPGEVSMHATVSVTLELQPQ